MSLFKRSAAEIFAGNSDDQSIPEYRVAAWASYDLKKHMREEPFTVDVPDDSVWTVSQVEDDLYEAHGVISLPVEMRLRLDRETGELTKDRVILNGEKRFDVREHRPESFDPLGSVNVMQAQAQAFNRYTKNISE